MQYYKLNDGTTLPQIGFGTYHIMDAESICRAIDMGYKLVDTAWVYENERIVGEGLDASHKKDVLVATKVWPNYYGKDLTRRSVERSLKDLKVDQLDIVYTHWPTEDIVEAWKALEAMQAEGIIKTLGVSNMNQEQLERFVQDVDVMPALNQIEVHPLWPELELVDYLQSKDIQVVAYSPLARMNEELLADPKLKAIMQRTGKTAAQVILRWQLERGILPIPKSENPQRQAENLDIFDFSLQKEEVAALNSLGRSDAKIANDSTDKAWQQEMKGREL